MGWVQQDAALRMGRRFLLSGFAMSSLLLLRAPGGFTVGDLLIVAAFVCAAIGQSKPVVQPPWPLPLAAMLVFIGGVISAANSSGASATVLVAVRVAFLLVVVPWTVLVLIDSTEQMMRLLCWWVGGAAVCAGAAVIHSFTGSSVLGSTVTNAGRYSGITGHVSDLGGIATGGAAFALVSLSHNSAAVWQRRFLMACCASCVAGLVLSGSVSGMVSLAFAGIVMVGRHGVRIRRLVPAVAAGVIVFVLVQSRLAATGSLTPFQRLFQVTGRNADRASLETGESRLELARIAWRQIQQSPIVGRGFVPVDSRLIDDLAVHNVILAAWHGGGLIMVIGVALPIVVAFRRGWLRTDNLATEGLFLALTAVTVFAFTGPSVYNRYFWLPVVLVISESVVRIRARVTTIVAVSPAATGVTLAPS